MEALLVGLAIGAILGLIGAGGAVLAVPAFLYLFGFTPLAATTASLAIVASSAAAGAIPRIRASQVRIKQALIFWSLGIAGAFAGSRLALAIPERILVLGFAAVMIGASVAMWRKSSAEEGANSPKRAVWLLPTVAIGVGVLTGLFGVGGGFLIVPALVLVFGLPFAMATGTSLIVVALTSVTALGFRFDSWSSVNWGIPVLVIIGGLVGAVLASRGSSRVPRRILERAFSLLLLGLAIWMVIESSLLTR